MTPNFPRVALPGVDQDKAAEVAALIEADREERAERTRFAIQRLVSLHRKGIHVYTNTVPATTIARRRAANRVAKASRKANR